MKINVKFLYNYSMILGIKVGLQKQSFIDIEQTNAPFAEVWFDVNRASEYTELFAEMKRRKMAVGLHFWGALPDGTWTNIAYPDRLLINDSMAMIKNAIEIASQNGFRYVNIHPGAAARVGIDFANNRMYVRSTPVAWDVAIPLCKENAKKLSEHANGRGIVFTVETVPMRIADGWYGESTRRNPKNIMDVYELPIEAIEQVADEGVQVANDFGHTSAIIANAPADVWRYIREKTIRLSNMTRLIHMGFVIPPYNGTDFHSMMNHRSFETNNAVPNHKQMIELLRLFSNRDDVWILTEPPGNHVRNYHFAKKILEEALGK